MGELGSADVLLFEGFRLDRRAGVLFRLNREGSAEPVALGSRAFNLLLLLVERHGELTSKDVIMQTVWPGRVVEEANLNVQISRLRDILGHGSIQTVPGHGYRFVAPVRRPEPAADTSVPAISQVGLPRPHLSIVVLPFTNLGEEREQQYFADGITADLTTDLSRLTDMFVISRHTAFTYRDKAVDTKQIGRELGVRYVLEGSVRRSGDQVRVNVQLIDAASDIHLWAERFDCDMENLFALQNEITGRIAVALDLELVGAEAARRIEHSDALDYILRGRAHGYGKAPGRENYAEAISLFEQALALDPRSAQAQSWLAHALAARVLDQMTDSVAADLARAEGLVGQALAASPGSPQAHFAKGSLLRARNRFEEAIPEYETVLAFNRNWVSAIAALGWCKFFTGSIEEALTAQEQAIRLSPRDPYIGNWYWRIGMVHLLQRCTEEAIVWLQKACSANPRHAGPHAWLASAYALKGDASRAAGELAEARRLSNDDRYCSFTRFKAAIDFGPKLRGLCESTFFAGLRKAGMPEV
jgi:TolB-like protein/Flp pilus assembly protein TadD